MLALKLVRALDRRGAPLGLTVEDAITRLQGVRLVRLGEPDLALWLLPDSYAAAQQETLEPGKRRLTRPAEAAFLLSNEPRGPC